MVRLATVYRFSISETIWNKKRRPRFEDALFAFNYVQNFVVRMMNSSALTLLRICGYLRQYDYSTKQVWICRGMIFE